MDLAYNSICAAAGKEGAAFSQQRVGNAGGVGLVGGER